LVSEQAGGGLPVRIEQVLRDARRLATVLPGVVAVGLAGSWARNEGRPESDVDIVLLLTDPAAALDRTAWFSVFGENVELVRSSDFGAMQERRLRLNDGLVVEVGVGGREWASIHPLDPGTAGVVRDGFVSLYDPGHVLDALQRAVASQDA
jgi:predicted nucleotidyltransferase